MCTDSNWTSKSSELVQKGKLWIGLQISDRFISNQVLHQGTCPTCAMCTDLFFALVNFVVISSYYKRIDKGSLFVLVYRLDMYFEVVFPTAWELTKAHYLYLCTYLKCTLRYCMRIDKGSLFVLVLRFDMYFEVVSTELTKTHYLYLCTDLTCTLRLSFLLQENWQKGQWCGFSPVCARMWFFIRVLSRTVLAQ